MDTQNNNSLASFNPSDFPFEIAKPVTNSGGVGIAYIFGGIGIVTIIVGFGFILLGPDTIYYDRYDGPTFVQFLQMYPGPIATAGFLLLGLAQFIASKSEGVNELAKDIDIGLKSRGVDPDNLPEGYELTVDEAENSDRFLVCLTLKEEQIENNDTESDQRPANASMAKPGEEIAVTRRNQ